MSTTKQTLKVQTVIEVSAMPPRAAADMLARGWDAMGTLVGPRGAAKMAFRSSATGAWVLL